MEARMDHSIGGSRAISQTLQIVERTALCLSSRLRQGCGGRIRAGESAHLMARMDEFRNNRGTNESCGAGQENTHSGFPPDKRR